MSYQRASLAGLFDPTRTALADHHLILTIAPVDYGGNLPDEARRALANSALCDLLRAEAEAAGDLARAAQALDAAAAEKRIYDACLSILRMRAAA